MWNRLMTTGNDWTATVLRVTLGVVMLPHGAQKLLGWFGGAGLGNTVAFFTETIGLPTAMALAIIVFEFVGGIALILGIGSRLAAVGFAVVMVGAIATVHLPNGFFMNWFGNQPGEGFEFHLLAIAIALAVAVRGSGRLSLDRALVSAATR